MFLRDEQGARPVHGGAGQVPVRPALARPDPLLRVLPRRQRRRPRRQPPDRLDGPRRPADPPLRLRWTPRSSWPRASAAVVSQAAPADRRERWQSPAPPVALSDQHAGLAPRAAAWRWAGRHARRRSRRVDRPDRRRRLRLGLAPRHLADRRGRARSLADAGPSGSPNTASSCPTSRPTTSAARPSPCATTSCTATSAARRRSARFAGGSADRGVRLMLDFVPNHTALDHPWVREHPEFYVHGSADDLAREPDNYCRVDTRQGPRVLAHGRDPYFPGWPDTLQLNYRHAGLREAMLGALETHRRPVRRRPLRHGHAGAARRLRAHLGRARAPDRWHRTRRRSVLAGGHRPRAPAPSRASCSWPRRTGTWSGRSSSRASTTPTTSASTIGCASRMPAPCAAICRPIPTTSAARRASWRTTTSRGRRPSFPPASTEAAAVLAFLVPGLRFLHEGQRSGRRRRTSNHLRRRVAGTDRPGVESFYSRLLACMRRPEVRDGEWRSSTRSPRGTAIPRGSASSRFPGKAQAAGCSSPSTTARRRGSVTSLQPGLQGRGVTLSGSLDPTTVYERDGDDLAATRALSRYAGVGLPRLRGDRARMTEREVEVK